MITDIEISGFQGHKDSSLSLGPTVNVIVGQSDSGKSSIIRALTWILKNRPSGDSFRNAELSKKDLVTGSIGFDDDSWIIRQKGNKINQYEVSPNNKVLKALRTDVPKEVSEISKIQDVNIQSQHPSDQYFMLTESPGQVAKEFNKVVGLTIMDEALLKINSTVRSTKQRCDLTNESIASHEIKIKDLSWTEQAKITLDELTKDQKEIVHLEHRSNELFILIKKYEEVENLFIELEHLNQAKEDFIQLSKKSDWVNENIKKLNSLYELQNNVKFIDTQLISTTTLKNAENEITALLSKDQACNDSITELNKLYFVCDQITSCNKSIKTVEMDVKSLQKEWNSYKGENCPLCGNIVGGI